jgi:YfiH family protein
VLTYPAWRAVPDLRHGFLDRSEPDASADLRVALPRQVHGTRIALATRSERPQADGLLTAAPGLGVGVVTADCVPVLLVDRRARAAAAVHAAAIAELGARFGSRPDDVEAVAGPAIGGCCYEIGPDVIAAFERRTGGTTAPALTTVNGRRHLDLRAAVRLLLAAAGVRAVAILGPCTACGGNYHSYRRDGAATGRQLSFVGWA